MLGIPLLLAFAFPVATATPTQEIYGGTDVVSCGWPTTVSIEGSCTGTLVHPQVVIYAQHCGTGYNEITFGETINGSPGRVVPTQSCMTYPGGGPGGGDDWAFCILAEPQNDIQIVPILMGCETSILTPGREVVAVGFGNANTGPYGIKREVTMQLNSINGQNEPFIGGGGLDTCQGDSGGPVFVQMPAAEGYDDTWRVFGITSYGGACGGGGYYSMMHPGIEWFETESGFDLTPCHDVDGTWNPTPDCKSFPLQPNDPGGVWNEGCDSGPLGGLSASCGAPFDASSDMDAPIVAISNPMNNAVFMSDPMSGQAAFPVEALAQDGMGFGVESVQLIINGVEVPGGELSTEPYVWNGAYPPGQYTFQAIATDFSGNVGESLIVYVGVDMDPPEPPVEGGDSSGGDTGVDSGTGADESGGPMGTGAETSGVSSGPGLDGGGDEGGGTDGCGCRSTAPSGTPWLLGLIGLLGLRRRRLWS